MEISEAQEKLIQAVKSDSLEIVEEALREGADINADGRDGMNALQVAALSAGVGVFKLLLERGADIHAVGYCRQSATQWAVIMGKTEVFRAALAAGGAVLPVPDEWLFSAARCRDTEMLKMLQSLGAALDVKDKDGRGLLHVAAHHDCERVCRFLVHAGLDVDAHDRRMLRPLHLAATRKNYASVAALVALGADTRTVVCSDDTVDAFLDTTPLCAAVMSRDTSLLLESVEHIGHHDDGDLDRALKLAREVTMPEMEIMLRSAMARRHADAAMVAAASPCHTF